VSWPEGADLVPDVVRQRLAGNRGVPPTEAPDVVEADVRTDRHVVQHGERTMRAMVSGSPAWKPQAMLASVIV
jgi:hypothetical protein